MTKTITRWAIAYNRGKSNGLYTGHSLTRTAAVREYVYDKGLGPDHWKGGASTAFSPYSRKEINEGWRYWQSQGDCAVKVKITFSI